MYHSGVLLFHHILTSFESNRYFSEDRVVERVLSFICYFKLVDGFYDTWGYGKRLYQSNLTSSSSTMVVHLGCRHV